MAKSPYASGRFAIAICDRCSFRYLLNDLRLETLSSIGAPSDTKIHYKVCKWCYDPPHPHSYLPLAIKAEFPDAEQLHEPRPDVFPIIYSLIYSPSSITQGASNVQVVAKGTYVQGNLTAQTDSAEITVSAIQQLGPQTLILTVSVTNLAIPGNHTIYITDGSGAQLRGLMAILIP